MVIIHHSTNKNILLQLRSFVHQCTCSYWIFLLVQWWWLGYIWCNYWQGNLRNNSGQTLFWQLSEGEKLRNYQPCFETLVILKLVSGSLNIWVNIKVMKVYSFSLFTAQVYTKLVLYELLSIRYISKCLLVNV